MECEPTINCLAHDRTQRKGRDTRCNKSLRHIAATSRLVCTAAVTRLLALNLSLRSNQFEFVQQIAATKVCSSGNDFHMPHEAICCSNLSRQRVAVICRLPPTPFQFTGVEDDVVIFDRLSNDFAVNAKRKTSPATCYLECVPAINRRAQESNLMS